MQIEFVNHSSFVVRSGDVRLISDPWLEGTAFDEGWALLSKTAMPYERFGELTHLWFSHEHPDHFSPPCLKKVPEDARRKIQVLYQETLDKKVVDYCKKLGFGSARELPHGKPVVLGPGFEFTCQPFVGFEDSWSLTRTKDARILNLNDCTVNTREQIEQVRAQVGEIDVLFTQFSISAWDGNALELERRQQGARKMLQRAVLQAQILKPKYLVPFASFIWFCHEENAYMNEAFLPIEEVYETLQRESGAEVLLFYPGDVWSYGERHDSARALARYQADIASLATRPRIRSRRVEEQELQETAQSFCQRVKEGASPTKLRLHLARQIPRWRSQRGANAGPAWRAKLDALLLRQEPARVYVSDLGRSYTFDLTHGLRRAELAEDACDVALGSEALWYGLKHLWGGQTLHINGRFRRILPGGRGPLFHFFDLAAEQSAGRPVAWKRARENAPVAKS
ncbi:MAG: MBL fold metallo-hydrolase [Planctomycetes bacterium]|nr:MBL fold metallo-hydrolase [Planctomycetota bacterium]